MINFNNIENVCNLIGHDWEYWSWSKADYEYAHRQCKFCLLAEKSILDSDVWERDVYSTREARGRW